MTLGGDPREVARLVEASWRMGGLAACAGYSDPWRVAEAVAGALDAGWTTIAEAGVATPTQVGGAGALLLTGLTRPETDSEVRERLRSIGAVGGMAPAGGGTWMLLPKRNTVTLWGTLTWVWSKPGGRAGNFDARARVMATLAYQAHSEEIARRRFDAYLDPIDLKDGWSL